MNVLTKLKNLFFLVPGIILLSGFLLTGCKSKLSKESSKPSVQFWLTDPANNILFQQQDAELKSRKTTANSTIIEINPTETFQSIDGFGWCLTGGSATLLNQMEASKRAALLQELFGNGGSSLGSSYLRVSIGASDLSANVFSYNDLPAGETDVNMEKFSLAPEKTDLIPILKEILAINPAIKILGSPWSPPTWMKTNNNSKGGSLKPEYYDAYALYFVKYIQGMAAEGIRIDAITIQNEPLHPGNNPSLLMLAEDQAAFIKKSLGPTFKKEKIDTKIIVYDHNADRPDYPLTILNDPEAAQYVDGSAFHLYGGTIDALSKVHDAHPEKNIYFTEQWVGAPGNMAGDLLWHVRTLIIGGTRNWSRTVLEWNLAADPQNNPHTDGGCTECLGAVTLNGNEITRNPAYYIVAHASKFVSPGSVRIASNLPADLDNVAFKTPEGKFVLIVANSSKSNQTFNIKLGDKNIETALNAGAVGTYVW
jgi:glucosylceramidase